MKSMSLKNKLSFIFKLSLASFLSLYMLSGCALFESPCGLDCEARHVCNGLNENFYGDKTSFEVAKRSSNSELARFYCVWQEGLVLPGGKDTYKERYLALQKADMEKKKTGSTTTTNKHQH